MPNLPYGLSRVSHTSLTTFNFRSLQFFATLRLFRTSNVSVKGCFILSSSIRGIQTQYKSQSEKYRQSGERTLRNFESSDRWGSSRREEYPKMRKAQNEGRNSGNLNQRSSMREFKEDKVSKQSGIFSQYRSSNWKSQQDKLLRIGKNYSQSKQIVQKFSKNNQNMEDENASSNNSEFEAGKFRGRNSSRNYNNGNQIESPKQKSFKKVQNREHGWSIFMKDINDDPFENQKSQKREERQPKRNRYDSGGASFEFDRDTGIAAEKVSRTSQVERTSQDTDKDRNINSGWFIGNGSGDVTAKEIIAPRNRNIEENDSDQICDKNIISGSFQDTEDMTYSPHSGDIKRNDAEMLMVKENEKFDKMALLRFKSLPSQLDGERSQSKNTRSSQSSRIEQRNRKSSTIIKKSGATKFDFGKSSVSPSMVSSEIKVYQYMAMKEDENKRLDDFLHENTGLPISMIIKKIRKKEVKLYLEKIDAAENRDPIKKNSSGKGKHSYRMQIGDIVSIRCPELKNNPAVNTNKTRANIPMTKEQIAEMRKIILFKNEDILVINKPPGLAVQGGSKIRESVDGYLHALQLDEYPEPPRIVHRIDKATSGALILARTKSAATRLAFMFAENKLEKMYGAIVTGFLPRDLKRRVIDVPLCQTGLPPYEHVICLEEDSHLNPMTPEGAKDAVTEYEVIAGTGDYSFLRLYPLTGRKHQLRVHCATILKAPVLGDTKYGSKETKLNHLSTIKSILTASAPSMHLHLAKIRIKEWKLFDENHKVAKKVDIEVYAPPPDYFRKSCSQLIGNDVDFIMQENV